MFIVITPFHCSFKILYLILGECRILLHAVRSIYMILYMDRWCIKCNIHPHFMLLLWILTPSTELQYCHKLYSRYFFIHYTFFIIIIFRRKRSYTSLFFCWMKKRKEWMNISKRMHHFLAFITMMFYTYYSKQCNYILNKYQFIQHLFCIDKLSIFHKKKNQVSFIIFFFEGIFVSNTTISIHVLFLKFDYIQKKIYLALQHAYIYVLCTQKSKKLGTMDTIKCLQND